MAIHPLNAMRTADGARADRERVANMLPNPPPRNASSGWSRHSGPRSGPVGIDAEPASLRREPVGDRAEGDDRENADHPVDDRDRERLGLIDAVDDGQDEDDAGFDDADPGRRQRNGREERPGQRDEECAADPEMDRREPERFDDE